MLQELRIKNFAIIDDISLSLDPGFLVLTGETGAGKSIIVDAVNLLLGDRADSTMVRAGTDRATIEGIFIVPQTAQALFQDLLVAEGLEGESPDQVILTREVRANGRSVARVNGVTSNLGVFREIGGALVDIHGQSEHLSLLKPDNHLDLLDRYAEVEEDRVAVGQMVRQVQQVQREIRSLETDEEALARRIDLLEYQVQEITAAAPRVEEEAELQQERVKLANAEKIAELAAEAQFALLGEPGETSAVDLLAQTAIVLGKLAKLDPELDEHYQLAETISAQADELANTVRAYYDEIEYDPHRLDEIEERVDVLTRLKRKYGGSIEAVLEHAAQAQAELDSITHSEERLAELREQEDDLLRQLGDLAAALSTKRQRAAQSMNDAIVHELSELRMESARFEVQVAYDDHPHGCYVGDRRLAYDETGIDHVEFYMAANLGEPLRPLVKVASGGETARIMLALKTVLSYADHTPTLIFDEVDQGIGGRLGSVLGQKLWRLSDHHQVLVVTHLAQLAGFADAHYQVTKHIHDNRTVTRAERLDDQARVKELADMLGAETASAHQSAFDILMLARRIKAGESIETA
ncbi:MAG: DNA repair protein RecN [Chloroflexi bacterium]|nr:DNA repair protein RecN [Chloroflexota bacterium]